MPPDGRRFHLFIMSAERILERSKTGSTGGRGQKLLRLGYGKTEYGLMSVLLAFFQDRRREIRLVYGVGEGLGLQAEAPAAGIGRAALAAWETVHAVARVELHAGLGGDNFPAHSRLLRLRPRPRV